MLKPGYRTSELLATVLVAIGALAAALAGELQPRYAAFASAISLGAYALGRGIAKAGATMQTPPVVPAQPVAPAPPPAP